MYGQLGQLSGARENLITALSVVLGSTKANEIVAGFESTVRTQAAAGTHEAITAKLPEIRRSVKAEAGVLVKPLFYSAAIVGGLGMFLGIVGLIRSQRRK